jgi:hypothetical protein
MTPDRRSPRLSNRLFRLFSRRSWGVSWPLLFSVSIGGLITSLSGAAGFQATPFASTDGGVTALWVIGIAVSIVVGLLAVMAGITKLAEPVARKVVNEHLMTIDHSALGVVSELKRQFDKAAERHARLASAIAVIDERVVAGFKNLPCREKQIDDCPVIRSGDGEETD